MEEACNSETPMSTYYYVKQGSKTAINSWTREATVCFPREKPDLRSSNWAGKLKFCFMVKLLLLRFRTKPFIQNLKVNCNKQTQRTQNLNE